MIAALGVGLMLLLGTAVTPHGDVRAGAAAYQTYCATCHGADLRGTLDGPSLRGVGAADVDFMLQTGRMPAAVPWIENGHLGAQLPPQTIDAIVAYVTSVAPGGPPIPAVVAGGNLRRGRVLYQQNCQHCHGINAGGASIGGAEWAPSLHDTSITQVAEAIRVGPLQMPKFGERQLDDAALSDIATYVFALDTQARTMSFPLPSSGPVPEGLVGWLAAGVLAVAAFAYARVR